MLLDYANATQRGLDFLDFLDDELSFKTLFVPVNEGFVDNMVTAGAWVQFALSGGPNPTEIPLFIDAEWLRPRPPRFQRHLSEC